jgi:hypothetical protein
MPLREEGDDEDSDDEDEEAYLRITQDDTQILVQRLKEAGEENLGMAMVYAMVMQLKESLTELLVAKQAERELVEQAEAMKVQEVCCVTGCFRRSVSRLMLSLLCLGGTSETQRNTRHTRNF